MDRLHWLPFVTRTWTGPVSVALFVPDVEWDLARHYVSFLRTCYDAVRMRVAFHLLFPADRPPRRLDKVDLGRDLPLNGWKHVCNNATNILTVMFDLSG